MILIHQRHRQTDRRTDRRTTCNLNTALCTSASRGKKWKKGTIFRVSVWKTTNDLKWATIPKTSTPRRLLGHYSDNYRSCSSKGHKKQLTIIIEITWLLLFDCMHRPRPTGNNNNNRLGYSSFITALTSSSLECTRTGRFATLWQFNFSSPLDISSPVLVISPTIRHHAADNSPPKPGLEKKLGF